MPTRMLAATAFVAIVTASGVARADDTIKHPGDHPNYSVELEPHGTIGWDQVYASDGIGLGFRATIPIVQNGFVPNINNNVGISFGVDLLRYSQCFYNDDCGAWYLYFPVAMQWNFFVAQKWSVFAEPGLFVFKGFFDGCSALDERFACSNPSDFGLRPMLEAGARYHFNEHVSLTMRVGYPAISVGASFF